MPDQTETIDLLRQSAILSDLSADTLDRIAAITERRTYDEGDAVYQIGDDALEVFIVATGRVRFTLGVGNRAGSSDSLMTTGHVFGWAALIEDQPRRLATAECLEPSELLAVEGSALLDVFEADTAAGYSVMRRLAAMIARNFMEVLAS